MSTVPVFAPDGSLGDIPAEKLQEAVKAGFKPGVHMTAPDGTKGVVPADRYVEAAKAGMKVEPFSEQPVKSPGLWHQLTSDLSGILPGLAKSTQMFNSDPRALAQRVGETGDQAKALAANDANRKQAGYSLPYRAAAPLAEATGTNVTGMEQSAAQGDAGGVLGHAMAVPATMAIAAGVSKGAGVASDALTKAAKVKAPEMYQSALKPSTTLAPKRVASMVDTGLKNEIPVSPAGVEKIGSLIDDLNAKIKQTVASDPTKTVNKYAVASRLSDTAKKFSNQVTPASDLEAISNTGNEFLRDQPGQIPAEQAQALKVGTYQQLKGRAYGELKSATIESQKALARGIKEELANAFPELKGLNAADSKLIDLEGTLTKAVQRNANHQLGGIGTPLAAAGAKAVTGSSALAAVTGVVKAIIDDPVMKSKLAIALSKAGNNVTLPAARSRIAAYSVALAASSEARADQNNEQAIAP